MIALTRHHCSDVAVRDKTSDSPADAEHLAAFALGSFGHHDPHTTHNEIHRMNGQGEQDIALEKTQR